MAKLKKGAKLKCVPCGREIIVDECGISKSTLWCCSRPMKPKSKVKAKAKPGKKAKKR